MNPRTTITVSDVAAMLGRSKRVARRLLTDLETAGLKRKGRGRGTHYRRAEFEQFYAEMDTRP